MLASLNLPTAQPARKRNPLMLLARLYAEFIVRHWIIGALVALTAGVVLIQAVWWGKLVQRSAYLGAVAFGAVVIDLFYARHRPPALPVRRPRLELGIAAVCLVLAFSWLCGHFSAMPSHLPRLAAVVYRATGGLLVLNVPIILIDLLALRYCIRDLGFRFAVRGLWAVPLIFVCFFGLAHLSEATSTINGIIREQGSLWRAVPVAIFVAAMPEEFFRMTWQTRFGAVTGNNAAAWFLTAVLWSFMHAPIFHNGEPAWTPALVNCLNLVPLGLLWGYALHRTRSLVPSMILHIFNVSGLQNF
jgi:membrane protease YdiL (CAAX protease family)